MLIQLDPKYLEPFISPHEYTAIGPFVQTAHQLIEDRTGLGGTFLGWTNLPSRITKQELDDIADTAQKIKASCDVLIVIGIGGSYLGARAAIEFINTQLYNQNRKEGIPEIYFAGNSISPDYLTQLLKICENRDVCINVISKSGTTTEPAIAFRIFYKLLTTKYGAQAKDRIFCTTDGSKGVIKKMADEKGFKTFVIPDDVGGRFSVLTPVGLLPIAAAGIDIYQLIEGAKQAELAYSNPDINENPCYKYAAIRNLLLKSGKNIEVLVSYEPALTMFGEWYKQLFGESEGKDHKGIFPASMVFSTDLHSLGQFVQDGNRNLFETVISFKKPENDIEVEGLTDDFDGLNFLAGQTMSEINKKAMQGTILAHVEGGVPNIILTLEERNALNLGRLFYFFEKACAISGYLLGVNPFDQPGVEAYKNNMFALLGKDGYEDLKKELEAKL